MTTPGIIIGMMGIIALALFIGRFIKKGRV